MKRLITPTIIAALIASCAVAIAQFPPTPTPPSGGGSGGATAANQTNGSQKTQIVDGSGNVISSSSNALEVDCVAGCSGVGTQSVQGTGTGGSPAGGVLTVQGTGSGTAIPVLQSTQPLPTGAATAANQTLSTSATGAGVPADATYQGGNAQSSEPAATTTGNLTGSFFDLTGKQVTSPYANRENMVRGSASATGTGATTIIAAQGSNVKTYITGVQCGRSDAGTSAITITLNDTATSVLVLPNTGGGGGNNVAFNVPLVTAANTAFTFTASGSTTTVYCSAQGFKGY
jgi:hypothetical protein